MAKSDKERAKDYYDRKKAGIEVPCCPGVDGKPCGKKIVGDLSLSRGICSRCWKKTPEGKVETKERVRRLRSTPGNPET